MSVNKYYHRATTYLRTKLTPLLYSGSTLTTALTQLAAGILVVKWVSPAELGTWQSVKLLQVYAFLLLLGVNNGLSRELPFFLGRGDAKFCSDLLGSALFAANIAAGVSVACTLTGLLVLRPSISVSWAVVAIATMIPLNFYQNILLVTYRSGDAFNTLTKIQYAQAIMSVATLPLVYFAGYLGLLLRPVVTLAASVVLMFKYSPLHLTSRWNGRAFKLLTKTGLPIFGLDYLQTSSGTADRVLALKFGGVTGVGFYTLAALVFQTLQTIPKSLSQYVYPKMSYHLGKCGNTATLWTIGFRWFALTTIMMAAAAAFGWWTLDYLVRSFAPTYSPGLTAAKIILFAGVFEGGSVIANIMWSVKAWRLMATFQVASSVVFVVCPLVASMVMSPSLKSIAVGVVAARAFRCVLALGLSYAATRGKYLQRYALQSVAENAA